MREQVILEQLNKFPKIRKVEFLPGRPCAKTPYSIVGVDQLVVTTYPLHLAQAGYISKQPWAWWQIVMQFGISTSSWHIKRNGAFSPAPHPNGSGIHQVCWEGEEALLAALIKKDYITAVELLLKFVQNADFKHPLYAREEGMWPDVKWIKHSTLAKKTKKELKKGLKVKK